MIDPLMILKILRSPSRCFTGPAGVMAVLLLLMTPTLHASDPFQVGVEAYHEARFAEAVAAFTESLEAGESAALRHNLALSYYQQAQPGEALWQIERALQLAPWDPDYRAKRLALRAQLGLDAQPDLWWWIAAQTLHRGEWIWLASLSAWALLAALLLPRMRRRRAPRFSQGIALTTGLVLALSLTALGLDHFQQSDALMIEAGPAQLRLAPASAAPIAGEARPGERLQVLGAHGSYLQVENESGQKGWLPTKSIRRIEG